MQKKVIALAVAGLVSGAAFAQSNVTIYGVADAGYVYATGDRAASTLNDKNMNFSGIQSGLLAGSRIGFKGEESLGNGLKAIFTMEYNVSIDEESGVGSASALSSRQAFVGLSHAKLGTVALGRQYAPGFYAAGRNDAFMSSTGIGSMARLQLQGNNTINGSNLSRWDNAVTYASPKFSGFSVNAAYGFAENAQNASQSSTATQLSTGSNGKFGVGLNYANGPLNLDAVYQSRRDVRGTTFATTGNNAYATPAVNGWSATGDNINEWYLGGSYDFKVVKLSASYQDMNDNNGTSATEISNNIWQVGATVPVFGNGKVHVGYSKLSYDRTGAGDVKAWNLMYSHSLSKRTTLYTGLTQFDVDSNATVGTATGFSNAGVGALGQKNVTYAAGMNHSF